MKIAINKNLSILIRTDPYLLPILVLFSPQQIVTFTSFKERHGSPTTLALDRCGRCTLKPTTLVQGRRGPFFIFYFCFCCLSSVRRQILGSTMPIQLIMTEIVDHIGRIGRLHYREVKNTISSGVKLPF